MKEAKALADGDQLIAFVASFVRFIVLVCACRTHARMLHVSSCMNVSASHAHGTLWQE